MFEELHGAPVAALMCFQIGGANGLLPLTWAARCGLPLVDADGMGRAFSELHQQAMHVAGVSVSPVALTDGRANTLVLRAADDVWAGRLARDAATGLGGVCAAAICGMRAGPARRAVVPGTVSLALRLGATMHGKGIGGALEALRVDHLMAADERGLYVPDRKPLSILLVRQATTPCPPGRTAPAITNGTIS
jgi:DUF917 family protein